MADPLRVLLVEDSPDDALLLERALREWGHDTQMTRVETAEEMLDALATSSWEVVLADHKLPRFGAMEALKVLQGSGRDLPFIVVTGTVGEERAAELLRAGAHDFILKDRLTRLGPAVEREIREAQHREERRRAQAELERARARYRALIESASDAVFVLGPDGEIRYSSPAAGDILGRPPEELVGMNGLDLVDARDRDRVAEELAAVVEESGTRRAEYRVVHPDGKVRHVESVATNLLQKEGVAGVVVNTRDLTERKELEAQLLQAQKMEAVGRLAGGIAHDFNNLLTIVTGNTEMLLARVDPDSEDAGELSEVLSASQRASALTRQLLTFSRHQDGEPRVVDLGAVVRGLSGMLQRLIGEDVVLNVDADREPGWVRADPTQLEQIIINFAVNAREVMPKGGRVEVTVRRLAQLGLPDVDPSNHDWVELAFEDTGPGVPEEIRDQIFEPFFSTKEMGTGLGLSTAYGIVKQSGGYIRLENASPNGARFVVALPEAEAPEDTPLRVSPDSYSAAPAEARILLVEDNENVRGVARKILEREEHAVIEAGSGEEALRILAEDTEFDLVISDLIMPGMRGQELADRIRGVCPGVPILFISGYSGDEYLDSVASAAGASFLEKPFTPNELARKVRAVLTQLRES